MTRSSAREIALGCIFEYGYDSSSVDEILESRFSDRLASLSQEDGLFGGELTDNDIKYISDILRAYDEHRMEIKNDIAALSVDWDVSRISRMSMAILSLAITEINCREDVPLSAAINEAVTLAKKYDAEKAPSFINGILGSYARSRGKSLEE